MATVYRVIVLKGGGKQQTVATCVTPELARSIAEKRFTMWHESIIVEKVEVVFALTYAPTKRPPKLDDV